MSKDAGLKEGNEELINPDKFDLEEFVNEEYPDPENPTPLDEPAPPKAEELKEEPVKEPKVEEPDNPVLPPGFKPSGEEPEAKEEPAKAEGDLDMTEIDKAIEAETNPGKRDNMARMRTKLQAQELELAEYRANKGEQPADSDLQKQLNEAHDQIARLDLQQDPRFQAKYDQKIRSTLKDITEMVKPNFDEEGEAETFVSQLANMDPISRNKFMIDNDVPEAYRMELVGRFKEADSIYRERQAALQNFAESKKNMDMDTTIQSQEQMSRIREAVKTKVVTNLTAQGERLLVRQPGNEQYNAFVDQRIKAVNDVINSENPEIQATYMVKGALMDTYKAMFELTQKELAAANAELAKFRGGKPVFNGGSSGGSDPKSGAEKIESNDDLAAFIVNNH